MLLVKGVTLIKKKKKVKGVTKLQEEKSIRLVVSWSVEPDTFE